MIVFPNAKVNVGLRVLRKRDDGFHALESLLIPIPLCDVLEVIQADGKGQCDLQILGTAIPGDLEDNLCFKAYHLLNSMFGLPAVQVSLIKKIPTGGGLAGGSSNGTFMLTALNNLFELGLNTKELQDFSAQLGSDCPFFVDNIPSLVSGRGEVVEPIALPVTGLYLAIVTPGIHISTAMAFDGIEPVDQPSGLDKMGQMKLEQWQSVAVNDFEKTVFAVHPELRLIKEDFQNKGAVYASMSGTGSTIFALFKERPDLPNAQVFRL